jgi:hypothetical protein
VSHVDTFTHNKSGIRVYSWLSMRVYSWLWFSECDSRTVGSSSFGLMDRQSRRQRSSCGPFMQFLQQPCSFWQMGWLP